MRSRSRILAIAAAVTMAAGLTTPATAGTDGSLACDNAAWKPYWTPGPTARGIINGDVRRAGTSCGNASVVAVVYHETGFWDEVAASYERTYAVGTITASNTCPVSGEYYTQIRINGVTVAQSDHVHIEC